MNKILSQEEVGYLTVFDGLTHIETPLLAEYIRHIEQAILKKLNSAEPACFVQVTPDGNPVWSEITKTKEGVQLDQYDRQMGWRVIPLFTHPPAPSAVTCQIYGHVVGACSECNTHVENETNKILADTGKADVDELTAARSEMKWQTRFLDLALMIAGWSKDSTKVGAVLVDGNRIISLGFNGFARGVSDDATDRATKLLRVIHAESNALAFANRDVSGCTMYCTHPPCAHCAAAMIQRGITKVVFREPAPDFKERWADHYNEAMLMFNEAGVEVTQA